MKFYRYLKSFLFVLLFTQFGLLSCKYSWGTQEFMRLKSQVPKEFKEQNSEINRWAMMTKFKRANLFSRIRPFLNGRAIFKADFSSLDEAKGTMDAQRNMSKVFLADKKYFDETGVSFLGPCTHSYVLISDNFKDVVIRVAKFVWFPVEKSFTPGPYVYQGAGRLAMHERIKTAVKESNSFLVYPGEMWFNFLDKNARELNDQNSIVAGEFVLAARHKTFADVYKDARNGDLASLALIDQTTRVICNNNIGLWNINITNLFLAVLDKKRIERMKRNLNPGGIRALEKMLKEYDGKEILAAFFVDKEYPGLRNNPARVKLVENAGLFDANKYRLRQPWLEIDTKMTKAQMGGAMDGWVKMLIPAAQKHDQDQLKASLIRFSDTRAGTNVRSYLIK